MAYNNATHIAGKDFCAFWTAQALVIEPRDSKSRLPSVTSDALFALIITRERQ